MAWSTPRTWVAGEMINAVVMNAHVRDQLLEMAPAKVTAAGDIVYASAANTLAKLAAGSAYDHLRINSAGSALEWSRAPAYVVKSADQSVNNTTTLANDSELLWPIAANEEWMIEFFIYCVNSNATPDIKFQIDVPSGAAGAWYSAALDASSATTIAHNKVFGSGTSDFALDGSNPAMCPLIAIVTNGANAGNVQLQFAQNSAHLSNTTIKQYSCLRATRLG